MNELYKARNEKILELRKQGQSLQAIGQNCELSTERVRQVIRLMIGYTIPAKLSYQRRIMDGFICQLCGDEKCSEVVIINLNKPIELSNIATVCKQHKLIVMTEHYKELPPSLERAKKKGKIHVCIECQQPVKYYRKYCSKDCRRLHNLDYLKTGLKTCIICKTEKPLTDFYKNHSNTQTYQSYCKICFCKITIPGAKRHNKSPEGKAYFKRYYQENRERLNAKQRERNRKKQLFN